MYSEFFAGLVRSDLALNMALRRQAQILPMSVLPAHMMAGRVYLEHLQGRHLTANRLVQEVSPELVSRATATRYIGDWVEHGLYELRQEGRASCVYPTTKLIGVMEDLLTHRLDALAAEGMLGRAPRTHYRIIRDFNGRILDAESTEATLGYSREWLIEESQDILNAAPAGHLESASPAAAVDLATKQGIWGLARKAGWLQVPWTHRDASGRMRPVVATIKPGLLNDIEVLHITCEIVRFKMGE